MTIEVHDSLTHEEVSVVEIHFPHTRAHRREGEKRPSFGARIRHGLLIAAVWPLLLILGPALSKAEEEKTDPY